MTDIGGVKVSLVHFSAAGHETPSDTKPHPGVCESNRGVGVKFSQPLSIQTIAFGSAFGMEPSGEAYGNIARDYDEAAQPAKRCESRYLEVCFTCCMFKNNWSDKFKRGKSY
jgi:hypothetical protein